MKNIGNDRFWGVIKALDWKNLCKTNHNVRNEEAYEIFKEMGLTPIDVEGFHQVAIACRKVLQDKIDKYSQSPHGYTPNNPRQ